MAHEPKLTVYTINLKAKRRNIELSNRNLFKHKINEASTPDLVDSYIFTEIFREFMRALDTPEMFSDEKYKKCMTANQPDREDPNINPNIFVHSEQYIIEGRIEGGAYGRNRHKTSTIDKSNKEEVDQNDAITDNFYFLMYMPLHSDTSILFLQSYTDDNIDRVMKKFWKNFLQYPELFIEPAIKRFIPKSIISDFKKNSTVSSLSFSTQVPGNTLLDPSSSTIEEHYKVTVKIESQNGIKMESFNNFASTISEIPFIGKRLNTFQRQKGSLKDRTTNNSSPFQLDSSFEVKPIILLSKYITFSDNIEEDFSKIKKFCFDLLSEIMPDIYITHAVRER